MKDKKYHIIDFGTLKAKREIRPYKEEMRIRLAKM